MTALNPYATPFVPANPMAGIESVSKTPFFQERFARFLFATFRDPSGGNVNEIQILFQNPPVQPIKKKSVQFVGSYKNQLIVYEADRLDDPRTGFFRTLV